MCTLNIAHLMSHIQWHHGSVKIYVSAGLGWAPKTFTYICLSIKLCIAQFFFRQQPVKLVILFIVPLNDYQCSLLNEEITPQGCNKSGGPDLQKMTKIWTRLTASTQFAVESIWLYFQDLSYSTSQGIYRVRQKILLVCCWDMTC